MLWSQSYRADPMGAALADRHYSRKTPGAYQFAPPGRALVLVAERAVWVSVFPRGEFNHHAWAPDAMVCTLFRNEGAHLSSDLVRDALAATRWRWPEVPETGLVTFIDPRKVKPKAHPGYCFRVVGFKEIGRTKKGLIVLGIGLEDFPDPNAPLNSTADLL